MDSTNLDVSPFQAKKKRVSSDLKLNFHVYVAELSLVMSGLCLMFLCAYKRVRVCARQQKHLRGVYTEG